MRPPLLALALAGLLAGPARAASAPPYSFALTVTDRPVTRPLPQNFLGLALEYGTIPEWTAGAGEAPNTVLPALVRGLHPTGPLSLRIGGQSTDRTWWPVAGMPRPLGVTHAIGASWIAAARTLAAQTDAQLLLGINLEAGSPRIAQVEADALVKGIGAGEIRALEIGNEPDLYRTVPWYRVEGDAILPWYAHTGAYVFSRPPGWGPTGLAAQFAQFARVLPALPLAGPETVAGPWVAALGGLLSPGSRLRMLTSHAYGLNQCVTDPLDPHYPSIPHLLSLTASRGMFAGVAPLLSLAHRDGASYRIDEMGSVTCNGRRGVSNTFASALWAMDALFDAARLGVDGINLHSYPDSSNGLFDFTYERPTHRWRAFIHPLYDGALMFAQAAPAGSRLLHIVSSAQSRLRAWATVDAEGHVRVLLVNDSLSATARVRIALPADDAAVTASVERLRAPSAEASTGITIGGQPFASTLTGVPAPPHLTSLRPHLPSPVVKVPAASAALLTLPAASG